MLLVALCSPEGHWRLLCSKKATPAAVHHSPTTNSDKHHGPTHASPLKFSICLHCIIFPRNMRTLCVLYPMSYSRANTRRLPYSLAYRIYNLVSVKLSITSKPRAVVLVRPRPHSTTILYSIHGSILHIKFSTVHTTDASFLFTSSRTGIRSGSLDRARATSVRTTGLPYPPPNNCDNSVLHARTWLPPLCHCGPIPLPLHCWMIEVQLLPHNFLPFPIKLWLVAPLPPPFFLTVCPIIHVLFRVVLALRSHPFSLVPDYIDFHPIFIHSSRIIPSLSLTYARRTRDKPGSEVWDVWKSSVQSLILLLVSFSEGIQLREECTRAERASMSRGVGHWPWAWYSSGSC